MARTNVATETFGGTLGNWTQWYPGWGNCSISAGVLTSGGGAFVGIVWSGSGTFGDDQYCKVTAGGLAWNGATRRSAAGVRLQGSDATRTGYFARVRDDAASVRTCELVKVLNGTETVLSTTTTAVANGDTIAIEATGTSPVTLTFWLNDAQLTALDITDSSSPITGGKPGCGIYDPEFTLDNADLGTLSSASIDQEGARFGADDGSESAHTWAAAQDAGLTSPLGTAVLIRALLNATGDPATAAYTLRYQKNGAGGYVPVPVGASVTEVYGTVTFGAIGTAANGGTSVAPSYPSGITSGQYLTCQVSSGATNSETPTTPSGWTLLATGASTDGTYGVDTGPRRMTVFGKIADGTESGTLTVSITNGGTCRGSIIRWTKAGSGAWVVSAQGGDDSTSGTGFSATFSSMNWNTGDATLVAVGQRVDTVTQSSQSLTASGVTFGAITNRESTAVTTGNDHRHVVDTLAAVTGTSNVNAAPTWSYTGSAACSGGAVVVRLREYTAPVTNEIYVDASPNIAAGGEATTALLTAPSGKSTADFVAGRRWDDENGADSIDITADDYTEVEWRINTQAPAANGDYFDLRVYSGAAALASYAVTPRLTLGTPATPSAPTHLLPQASAARRLATLLRY